MTRRFTRCVARRHRRAGSFSTVSAGSAPGWGPGRARGRAGPATWTADNGNGTFSNPLFYDEFSDSDLIRVGERFLPDRHDHAQHAGPADPALARSGELAVPRLRARYARSRPGVPSRGGQAASTARASGRRASAITTARSTSSATSTARRRSCSARPTPPGRGRARAMKRSFHDLSVLFDDDGKAYVVWGYRGIRLARADARSARHRAGHGARDHRAGRGHGRGPPPLQDPRASTS